MLLPGDLCLLRLASKAILLVGRTADIQVSALEQAVTTRVKAAQVDNAEVDLSQWAPEDETPEVANARAALRRFSARWWSYYQECNARSWLASQGSTCKAADIEAIEDCVRRVKACTCWAWPRGSRLTYWNFLKEWGEEYRDGTPFW